MIVTILCFIVLSSVFILSAISYSNLNKNLQLADVTTTKQVYYQQVKRINLALLILSGLALMIQGFVLLWPNESRNSKQFQGNKEKSGEEKCGASKCSGTEGLQIGNDKI